MSGRAVAGSRLALVSLLALVSPAGAALGAEVTRVASGRAAPGEGFDFHLSAAFGHERRTAAVRREAQGPATGGRIAVADDLVYRQSRDVLHLRMDVGVLEDLGLFVTAPLVLADRRSLDFARAGCGGGGGGCVDERSATILRDGILPGFGGASFGWDAVEGRRFTSGSETVFRGPVRRGLESLGLGASYAVMNQARDPTRPTWLVRFESRFAVGPDRRYDPARPDANRAVGLGYHQLVLSTVFSRRFDALDPYLGLWYMLPRATGGGPFGRYALGSGSFGQPQQRAGTEVGLEATAWEAPAGRRRLALELRGRMELRMFGLAQGELWEPLSGPSTCPTDRATCRAGIDRDLTGDGVPDPNPGVTRSPSYGLFGGDAGLSAQLGRFARLRGLFGVTFEQSRMLTDARSGFGVYDDPGRRFRVEAARSWHLLLDGALLF